MKWTSDDAHARLMQFAAMFFGVACMFMVAYVRLGAVARADADDGFLFRGMQMERVGDLMDVMHRRKVRTGREGSAMADGELGDSGGIDRWGELGRDGFGVYVGVARGAGIEGAGED